MIDGKKMKVKELTEAAHSLVSRYEAEVRAGRLSEGDAKQAALADLRSIRYGDNDYFWVNDMTPTMIMHPIKPELDGNALGQMKTPEGARLFVDMADIARNRGGDFYQ